MKSGRRESNPHRQFGSHSWIIPDGPRLVPDKLTDLRIRSSDIPVGSGSGRGRPAPFPNKIPNARRTIRCSIPMVWCCAGSNPR
jgi:hypothetical protein